MSADTVPEELITESEMRAKLKAVGVPVEYSGVLTGVFAQLIAAHEARQWQAIETAPKDGTPVLLGWSKGFFEPSKGHYEPGGWGQLESDMSFHVFDDQPDFYRLLPPPPSDGGTRHECR